MTESYYDESTFTEDYDHVGRCFPVRDDSNWPPLEQLVEDDEPAIFKGGYRFKIKDNGWTPQTERPKRKYQKRGNLSSMKDDFAHDDEMIDVVKSDSNIDSDVRPKRKYQKRGNLNPMNDDFARDDEMIDVVKSDSIIDNDVTPRRKYATKKLDADFLYGDELIDVGEPIPFQGKVLTKRKYTKRKTVPTREATLQLTKIVIGEVEKKAMETKMAQFVQVSCDVNGVGASIPRVDLSIPRVDLSIPRAGLSVPTVIDRMRYDFGTEMSQCYRGFQRDDSCGVVPIEQPLIDAACLLDHFNDEKRQEIKIDEAVDGGRQRRAVKHRGACPCCQ